ncbi:MAG TPA: (2Fe-2S) ferredoxin domain-containing protein [Planctomycetota bacterium]|nr:(2Fe-2S) ferredoxin domain-containing protein [Planctomycetota bacterium]
MGPYDLHIFVCTNSRDPEHPRGSCGRSGSADLLVAFKEAMSPVRDRVRFRINQAGCLNFCEHGPVVALYPENIWYRVKSRQDVKQIVDRHLHQGQPVPELQIPEAILRPFEV